MSNLRPDQVQKIHEYIHNKQLINAIRIYREATGVGLAEAKEAVEEMARNEFTKPPSDIPRSGDPIMDGKILSLLAKRKKVEAVKIYREEHGISLREAKDYVDRIESSMRRESPSTSMPYESAIGGDPFEDIEGNRRRAIVLAVSIVIALCGIGVFFALMNF